jgi:hypothetical protein
MLCIHLLTSLQKWHKVTKRGWDGCTTTDCLVTEILCSESNYTAHWCQYLKMPDTMCTLLIKIHVTSALHRTFNSNICDTEYISPYKAYGLLGRNTGNLVDTYQHLKRIYCLWASRNKRQQGSPKICTISTVYCKNFEHKLSNLCAVTWIHFCLH